MKIVILAFNIGISKGFVNGPGISLYNFAKFISENYPNLQLFIYTQIESQSKIPGVTIRTTRQSADLREDIADSKVFHLLEWLDEYFSDYN